MNFTWDCSNAICQTWKLLHWVELVLGISGLILNSSCFIRIFCNFRNKFDISVTLLLLHALLLLLVASLYFIIKPIVTLFWPFTTSLVMSFVIGLFLSIPLQLSAITAIILLLERHYTIKYGRSVKMTWVIVVLIFMYFMGIGMHFVHYRIILHASHPSNILLLIRDFYFKVWSEFEICT